MLGNSLLKREIKFLDFFKTKNNAKEKNDFDYHFVNRVQPQGGIAFAEKYIRMGDGYVTSICVYEYPSEVTELWLNDLMNIENTIVTLDVSTYKKNEALRDINKSLKEFKLRYYYNEETTEKVDAEERHGDLINLYKNVSNNGEAIKNIKLRLFICARTITDIEEKVKSVLEILEGLGCKGSIYLNEMDLQYKSLFTNLSTQTLCDKIIGNGMGSNTLGAGLPFYSSNLQDQRGSYYGNSSTGSPVMFDLFYKDNIRKYYNAVVLGLMGAGKSTLLKKITIDNVIKGNVVRTFDITGEFRNLVDELGGKYISLDGSDGVINPLEIFKTDEDEYVCFSKHISKLSTFFEFLSPNLLSEDKDQFEFLARELYEKFNLLPENRNKITGRIASRYPVFSDLLKHIQGELYEDSYKKRIKFSLSNSYVIRLERIELRIKNLIANYGYLFDKHSTINNLLDEKFVCFYIRNLTSLKREIFSAQLFSTLSLLWDELIRKGAKQKELFENKRIDINDVENYLLIIDEAAKIINTQNLTAVEYISYFAREARKYFGSIFFAMHSIRDCIFDGANSEAINNIRTLFELTQYKFIMQQDSNSLSVLEKVFEDQLSDYELKQIPQLTQGEAILSISGSKNIRMNIALSEKEKELFKGGV